MSSTGSPPGTRAMVAVRHVAGIADARRAGDAPLPSRAVPRSGPLAPDCSRLVACSTVPDVLIATDADWIFDEVDAALADEETTVHRVRRGRDVSEAARRIQPEVIVLDMQIGNMGGIATALSLEQEF